MSVRLNLFLCFAPLHASATLHPPPRKRVPVTYKMEGLRRADSASGKPKHDSSIVQTTVNSSRTELSWFFFPITDH